MVRVFLRDAAIWMVGAGRAPGIPQGSADPTWTCLLLCSVGAGLLTKPRAGFVGTFLCITSGHILCAQMGILRK